MAADKPYPIRKFKDYPLWYHNSRRDSDKKFVLGCMYFIPDKLKAEVSNKYENIYQSRVEGFRGKANKYLHSEAIKHKDKKGAKRPLNVDS